MDDHCYSEKLYVATPVPVKILLSDQSELLKKAKSNRICCVPECHTTGYEPIKGHGKPSYHRFPPEGDPLREKWLLKIRRNENKLFKVQSHTVVCSLHFPEEMVEISGFSKRRFLKPGAVPTVFECWKNKPHIYKPYRVRPENQMQRKKNLNSEPLLDSSVDELDRTVDLPEGSNVVANETNAMCDVKSQACEAELQKDLLVKHIKLLENKISSMEQKQIQLDETNKDLRADLQMASFCIENIKPSEFQFYTGFQSRTVFDYVLQLLNPGPNCENMVMVPDKDVTPDDNTKRTRCRKLSPQNQFFLFLCRVRLGLFEMDLAKRFNVSVATVSNVVISWANFCYLRLGMINIWPSREMVDKTMPSSFKAKYPSTRVIIDCTEIKVNMPSSLLLKSQTYSNYKSANTLKGLIGIAPCGSVTFVSQLYHGSISDREITVRSGFLNLPFDKGDSIMADKGFDIQDLLDEKSVHLNMPPFLGNYGQMTDSDVYQTQSIAAERIHVERAINKIKNFHIFDQAIPVTLFGSINQLWTVCALLTLFQDPILSCPGSESVKLYSS